MSRSLAVVLTVSLLNGARADGPAPRIEVDKDFKEVRVIGVDAANLKALRDLKPRDERWSKAFGLVLGGRIPSVHVGIAGSYRVRGDVLVFEPTFPFAKGSTYVIQFHADKLPHPPADVKPLQQEFTVPKPKPAAKTSVLHVYPTKNKLPENQLKFYFHFSAPMRQGDVYKHIRLLDEAGKQVTMPFLQLDEELWNSQGTRFTLFFDPGRIKRGLKPREELGPPLIEGKKYTLVIDSAWPDGDGEPLKETVRKSFSVVAPDDTCPDPKKWKLEAPAAGATKPLVVRFPESLDHGLVSRLLRVTDAKGEEIEGKVEVTDEETCWRLTPKKAWVAGSYHLEAGTLLEDLAGNSIAQPFEVDVFKPIQREIKQERVRLPFTVK